MPVALQAIFTFLCFACLFLVPEPPRWLVHKNRLAEALTSLASTHSNGDESDPHTLAQHREIVETLEYERQNGQHTSYGQIFRTLNSRRRLLLVVSVSILAQSCGRGFFVFAEVEVGGLLTFDRKQHRFVLFGRYVDASWYY